MAYQPANPNGQATMANSAPVVIASNQTAVPVSGTVGVSGTVPVSAASLPLPSGAATAAKQPALGTAGTPSADVLTVQGTASMTALKVDGSAVTQPVSGTVTANLGTVAGLALDATLTGGGQKTRLVDAAGSNQASVSAAGALKVDGSAVTQPVSGTVGVSGTVAVSAASLPLPTGAATAAKQPALGTAGSASADVITVQGVASMTPLKVDGSAVTQPVSGAVTVSGTVTANIGTTGGVALDATLTGGTMKTKLVDSGGTNVATVSAAGAVKVDGSAVTQPVSIAAAVAVTDNSGSLTVDAPASAPVNVWVANSGATQLRFYAVAAASGTTGTETAITLTKSSGTSATTTGTSFTPTSGKTFKITSIVFAARGHNTATAQVTTFSIRINTAGAVTTGSTPIILRARVATPATANSWDRIVIPLPDAGLEIPGDGTLQFGVTANAVFVTNAPTWDVLILGQEY